MTTITELERKVKAANAKIYTLETERQQLLRILSERDAEILALKTPRQLTKEKKGRENTLKKQETFEVVNDSTNE